MYLSSSVDFMLQIPSSPKAIPKSSLMLFVVALVDRDPRKHNNNDFTARNDSFTRKYRMMTSYLSPRFSLILEANALWKTEHSWLITPVEVNTNGVNVPRSTSMLSLIHI